MPTQIEKAASFRSLHEGPRAFVIANPWDAGSARILAGLGYAALATSSGAAAGTLGRRDGKVRRDGFMLTARTENFLRGNPDLDDTIRRLQAFEKAGADVLMAPGLPDLAAVRAVCAAVSKPVNFMAGIKGKSFSVAELEAAGVKRISVATSLYRAAMTGLLDAAREIREKGSFSYLERTMATPDLNKYMQD